MQVFLKQMVMMAEHLLLILIDVYLAASSDKPRITYPPEHNLTWDT